MKTLIVKSGHQSTDAGVEQYKHLCKIIDQLIQEKTEYLTPERIQSMESDWNSLLEDDFNKGIIVLSRLNRHVCLTRKKRYELLAKRPLDFAHHENAASYLALRFEENLVELCYNPPYEPYTHYLHHGTLCTWKGKQIAVYNPTIFRVRYLTPMPWDIPANPGYTPEAAPESAVTNENLLPVTSPDIPVTLPPQLNSDLAQQLWQKAQQAGLVDSRYQYLGSRTEAAYFAGLFGETIGISTTNHHQWSPFEELWHTHNMRQDWRDAGETVRQKVDAFFKPILIEWGRL